MSYEEARGANPKLVALEYHQGFLPLQANWIMKVKVSLLYYVTHIANTSRVGKTQIYYLMDNYMSIRNIRLHFSTQELFTHRLTTSAFNFVEKEDIICKQTILGAFGQKLKT